MVNNIYDKIMALNSQQKGVLLARMVGVFETLEKNGQLDPEIKKELLRNYEKTIK